MKFLTAAKAYVALIGAVLAGLAGIYGDQEWYAIAVAVVTAVATFAVPNARSADPTTSTPDV
jgi:hypothetical protein